MFGLRKDILLPILVSAFAFSLDGVFKFMFPVETAATFVGSWMALLLVLNLAYRLHVSAFAQWVSFGTNRQQELSQFGKVYAVLELATGYFLFGILDVAVRETASWGTNPFWTLGVLVCVANALATVVSVRRLVKFSGTPEGLEGFANKFGTPVQTPVSNAR